MIGLVDCNNFYVSCERVFEPSLNGKPVIVLSNNDGCAISRSNEAKALGIKMGVPEFEVRGIIEKHRVRVFSSNYTLYGDMSRRVMDLLAAYVPSIEVYSIDEAFLDLSGIQEGQLMIQGKELTREVARSTGIPLTLGISSTRTLAKVANKLAKKNGLEVCMLQPGELSEVLDSFPVDDVWGIGKQHAALLRKMEITTAGEFTRLPREWVRKTLTVVGLRLYDELKGEKRFFGDDNPVKKNICTSRCFGEMQTARQPVEEAVSMYASRCAEKLRSQGSLSSTLTVFLHTNQFRNDLAQYARHIVIPMPVATNSTLEIVRYAIAGLRAIFRKGYQYKKAGVMVSDLVDAGSYQQNIFDRVNRASHLEVMHAVDKMNHTFGRDTVRVASQGFDRPWRLRQEKLSPSYTTRLSDIITINA